MAEWGAPVQADTGSVQQPDVPAGPVVGNEDTARDGKYGAHGPELDYMKKDVKKIEYPNDDSAYPSAPAFDEKAATAPMFEDKHGRPVYEESQSGGVYSKYKFLIKDYVLCTILDPPPAPEAAGWQFGRVTELMLDDQIRVKLGSGEKVVVTRGKGQIRALNPAEIKQHKKESNMEIPCWYMVICFPCMAVAAPFYFCGCCDGGIDVMGECFEECVECICEPLCSCECFECCC